MGTASANNREIKTAKVLVETETDDWIKGSKEKRGIAEDSMARKLYHPFPWE